MLGVATAALNRFRVHPAKSRGDRGGASERTDYPDVLLAQTNHVQIHHGPMVHRCRYDFVLVYHFGKPPMSARTLLCYSESRSLKMNLCPEEVFITLY
jgi:hypothetical protein